MGKSSFGGSCCQGGLSESTGLGDSKSLWFFNSFYWKKTTRGPPVFLWNLKKVLEAGDQQFIFV